MFNGGGGGNGKYSGGGGGANRGAGSDGGSEDAECVTALDAIGKFGIAVVDSRIDTVSNTGGVFLGGGGGASTYLSGANAKPGGNGGGIVLLISDAIEGNGKSITASGDSATTAINDVFSGAGGGGAGGSVMIFSQNYSTTTDLFINVNGSKGGDVYHDWLTNAGGGTGGAGGGGYVGLLKPETGTVHINKSGGGNSSIKFLGFPSDPQSNSGEPGLVRTGVLPVLTGFLFNSISSKKSGNQIDSTCSNVPFGEIVGTSPVGGKLPYTVEWQYSTDGTTFNNIPGVTTLNYTPGTLGITTWFRRIITDNSATPIVDISKPVKVIVHPKILNNIIVASPDSICFASDPQLIKQGVPDLVVPQSKGLSYVWQDSTVGGVWGAPLETTFKVKELDPNPTGGLLKDTWYRRIVFSGSCTDRGAITKITAIPVIQNNAFTKLNDTICFGGNTNLNTIAGPSGGVPGKYKYEWEASTVSSTGPWAAIAGVTSPSFDPDASVSLPSGNHFYRRIVYSGELNTCKDITPAAIRKVWPVITNNSKISPDKTIGYDSIPPLIIATDKPPLSGGDGNYKFVWGKSTSLPVWSAASGTNNSKDYLAPNLQSTTWFRRRVNSSVCTSVSDSVKITVDAKIINSISLAAPSLDTIYSGGTSSVVNGILPTGGSGVPNDYSYKWYKSTEVTPTNSGWTLIAGAVSQNYSPGILTQSAWYRRDVSSPVSTPRSTVKSSFLRVTVLPKIQNFDISASQKICPGYQPAKLQGNTQISGGDGKYRYTWQDSTSGHTWSDIPSLIKVSSPEYNPPVLNPPEIKYRRITYSGKNDCATETSNFVKITFDIPVTNINAGNDTTLNSFDYVFHFNPDPIKPWETGVWSSDDSNITFKDINLDGTIDVANNLSPGDNTLIWTVTSGTCSNSDNVNVTVTKIEIPEGFSPNSDGYNDTFEILGLDLENQIAELSIQNSSGAVVFSTTNHLSNDGWIEWDGKNSKGIDLPEGTYYYLLKITSDPKSGGTGAVKKWNGFIVLKRY
jgi:gliding motility-associated-like protein